MTVSPSGSPSKGSAGFGRIRLFALLALVALLTLCAVFSWSTRDAMAHLHFLREKSANRSLVNGKRTLVDLRPWQTAQALAPLAVSAEEKEYARDAERLAGHEVDQAFASALRLARLQAQNRTLSGEALALSQKVAHLGQLVKQDKALVDKLTAQTGAGKEGDDGDDLDVAKAQLGLDSDELAEAQGNLDRASGDNSNQIQSELSAHEAAMRQSENQSNGDGQVAILSVQRHKTLATRLESWFNQRSRYQLLQQAIQQAQADIKMLTAESKAREAKVNASADASPDNASDHTARIFALKSRSAEREILGIYEDRIETQQQLADVYEKWSAQTLLQHRIVFHMMLQSLMLIIGIAISMVLLDWLVRRLMSHPSLQDRRQTQTLSSILEAAVQVLGVVLILLVVFGAPQQTSTVLGLATAALTIALQDFILAFFGWFILVGRNGIHIGDLVEIDGVGGEVLEVGLFSTTLLETGSLTDKGRLTGRRISFINSFAIRGKFFNFSTAGQWMWDEIALSMPATADLHTTTERIRKAVDEETQENASAAELDWKRAKHGGSRPLFDPPFQLGLRPSSSGIDVTVRYVTRASERFEVRDRLNRRLIDLLNQRA